MSTIRLEVEDAVAERFRSASPTAGMMVAYLASDLFRNPVNGSDYRSIREEFQVFQRKNGVAEGEWEQVFAELCAES